MSIQQLYSLLLSSSIPRFSLIGAPPAQKKQRLAHSAMFDAQLSLSVFLTYSSLRTLGYVVAESDFYPQFIRGRYPAGCFECPLFAWKPSQASAFKKRAPPPPDRCILIPKQGCNPSDLQSRQLVNELRNAFAAPVCVAIVEGSIVSFVDLHPINELGEDDLPDLSRGEAILEDAQLNLPKLQHAGGFHAAATSSEPVSRSDPAEIKHAVSSSSAAGPDLSSHSAHEPEALDSEMSVPSNALDQRQPRSKRKRSQGVPDAASH